MQLSARVAGLIISISIGTSMLVWSIVFVHQAHLILTVIPNGAFGTIVVQTPYGGTILIGGGVDSEVVRAVSRVLPWYQHSVDAIFFPQLDGAHSGGAIDLVERYTSNWVFVPQNAVAGSEWVSLQGVLQSLPTSTRIKKLTRGQTLETGRLQIEILFPDRLMSHADSKTTCSPMRLLYGTTSMLIMCDSSPTVIPYLTFIDGHTLQSDIIIIPESVFKSDTVRTLLGFTAPTTVVVTHSCKTSIATSTAYIVKKFNANITDPCAGAVTIESDGMNMQFSR